MENTFYFKSSSVFISGFVKIQKPFEKRGFKTSRS